MGKKDRKAKSNKPEEIGYEVSSGNIFKDFGYPNPEKAKAKSELAFLIRSIIKKTGLTQEMAANIMGIDQPKVSKITSGRLSEFTLEWLMNCLVSLGFDLEIRPTRKSKQPSIHVDTTDAFKRVCA